MLTNTSKLMQLVTCGSLSTSVCEIKVLPSIVSQRFYWRERRDRSQVPRVSDSRDKRMYKISDMGYTYRYHRQGVEPMPRIKDCREPLFRPEYKVREPWNNG
jgi:hypothetical protein